MLMLSAMQPAQTALSKHDISHCNIFPPCRCPIGVCHLLHYWFVCRQGKTCWFKVELRVQRVTAFWPLRAKTPCHNRWSLLLWKWETKSAWTGRILTSRLNLYNIQPALMYENFPCLLSGVLLLMSLWLLLLSWLTLLTMSSPNCDSFCCCSGHWRKRYRGWVYSCFIVTIVIIEHSDKHGQVECIK